MARNRTAGRGDGTSWYRTSAGTYRGWCRFTNLDGTTRTVYRSGKSLADVRAKIVELREARDAGAIPDGGKVTLAKWLTTYLAEREHDISPSTWEAYESALRLWVIPRLGEVTLEKLRSEQIHALYQHMRSEGKSSSRINDAHNVISGGLEHALRFDRVRRNVARQVPRRADEVEEVDALTREESRRVLASIRGQRGAARWSVAMALGIRQSEALALSWDRVDLDEGTIRVDRQIKRMPWRHGCGVEPWPCGQAKASKCPDRHGGGVILRRVKSKASRRTIEVPAQLVTELRAHRKAMMLERLQDGDWQPWRTEYLTDGGKRTPIEVELVFPMRGRHPGVSVQRGGPRDRQEDWREWKAILLAADIRVVERGDRRTSTVRVHDLRHAAATLLLEQGVDVKVVSEILGHSSVTLTRNTYQHVRRRMAQEAAAAMGDVLWGAGS